VLLRRTPHQILLRTVLQPLDRTRHLLLVSHDRHHLLLHPHVGPLKTSPDLDISRVLLHQPEDSLQDHVENSIVLHPLSESAVV
jgi:hypothetical protein